MSRRGRFWLRASRARLSKVSDDRKCRAAGRVGWNPRPAARSIQAHECAPESLAADARRDQTPRERDRRAQKEDIGPKRNISPIGHIGPIPLRGPYCFGPIPGPSPFRKYPGGGVKLFASQNCFCPAACASTSPFFFRGTTTV